MWIVKINVWGGKLGDEIIEAPFLDAHLRGELYLNILDNEIIPLIMYHSTPDKF